MIRAILFVLGLNMVGLVSAALVGDVSVTITDQAGKPVKGAVIFLKPYLLGSAPLDG